MNQIASYLIFSLLFVLPSISFAQGRMIAALSIAKSCIAQSTIA